MVLRRLGAAAFLLGIVALAWAGWSTLGRVAPGRPAPAAQGAVPWQEEAWPAVVALNRAAVAYAPSGDLHQVAPYLDLAGPAYQEFKAAQQERAAQGIVRRSALREGPTLRRAWQEGAALFVETGETWDEVGYRLETGEVVYVVSAAASVQRYELRRGADGRLRVWAIEEVP